MLKFIPSRIFIVLAFYCFFSQNSYACCVGGADIVLTNMSITQAIANGDLNPGQTNRLV